MSGKLIVLEGTDGSGKSTQKKLLTQRLTERGVDFREVTFPRYDMPSSALVKMYLGGDFGANPTDVSAQAASVLYAVDRYASFKTDWGDYYNSGGLIICDRYTTSNAIHQTPKLDKSGWWDFTNWLFDFEYHIMGLPAPTQVFFLDMPTENSLKLIDKRQGDTGDIHEKDHHYLSLCYVCALEICKKYHWERINCVENGQIRPVEAISQEIMQYVLKQI